MRFDASLGKAYADEGGTNRQSTCVESHFWLFGGSNSNSSSQADEIQERGAEADQRWVVGGSRETQGEKSGIGTKRKKAGDS